MMENKKRRVIIFFVLILICLFSSSVLLLEGVIEGKDTFFHMTRVQSLSRSIKNGIIPCYVEPEMLDGFGYATSLFYCDFMFYIPAIMVCMGMNSIIAYKLFLIIICFLAVWSYFYAAKEITNDSLCGIVCAAVIACSNYFYIDMFYRGATGETLAFIFVPWVIMGAYNILYADQKKWWQIAVGFSGLLMSHVLSFTVMCILFALIIILYLITAFFDNNFSDLYNKANSIFKAAVISIGITSWFLFPIIEQLATTKFLSSYFAETYNPINSAIRIRNLFITLDDTVINHNLGVVIFVLSIISAIAFFKKNKNDCEKFLCNITVIAFACMIGSTSLFPWLKLDPYFNIIQFPTRLHLFTTILISLVGSYWMVKYAKKYKLIYIFIVLIVGLQVFFYNHKAVTIYENKKAEDKFMCDEKSYRYYDENYLHINTNRTTFMNRWQYVGQIRGINNHITGECQYPAYGVYNISFSDNHYNNNYLEMPIHYYRGYEVKDESGNLLDTFPSEERGWLTVDISNYDNGELTVIYGGTFIQKASLLISIAFCAGILYICFYKFTAKDDAKL
ncbi:MAG: hypothetical protein IJ362_05295 [Oscillospiraceae bacterium]|nr:hypothetical protein [Oscillospiraceae bacterium]